MFQHKAKKMNKIGPSIEVYRKQYSLSCAELSCELQKLGYAVSPRRIELLESQTCTACDLDVYYFSEVFHLSDADLLFHGS